MKKVLLNKYFLATLAFVLLLIFSKSNGIVRQIKQSRKIERLKAQKAYYKKEIENTKKTLNALQFDTARLEKFAREKYFMKKDNEDVFVIIRKSKDTKP